MKGRKRFCRVTQGFDGSIKDDNAQLKAPFRSDSCVHWNLSFLMLLKESIGSSAYSNKRWSNVGRVVKWLQTHLLWRYHCYALHLHGPKSKAPCLRLRRLLDLVSFLPSQHQSLCSSQLLPACVFWLMSYKHSSSAVHRQPTNIPCLWKVT